MARLASKVKGDGFVRFEFADGECIQCNLDDLKSADIISELALHGISQKVGDAYAGAESITEARGLAQAVWNNLVNGLFNVKTARGGKIVEALHRVTGQPLNICLEKWQGMDDAAKKGLKAHAAIKGAIAEIDAEKAQRLAEAAGDSGTDLGGLFD